MLHSLTAVDISGNIDIVASTDHYIWVTQPIYETK